MRDIKERSIWCPSVSCRRTRRRGAQKKEEEVEENRDRKTDRAKERQIQPRTIDDDGSGDVSRKEIRCGCETALDFRAIAKYMCNFESAMMEGDVGRCNPFGILPSSWFRNDRCCRPVALISSDSEVSWLPTLPKYAAQPRTCCSNCWMWTTRTPSVCRRLRDCFYSAIDLTRFRFFALTGVP